MDLPSRTKSRAVLVGAARYGVGNSLSPLPGVRRNLDDLYRVLTDRDVGFLSPSNCLRLPDPASPRVVSDALILAAEHAEDTLLFYFAGHGAKAVVTGELHLMLTDSDPANLPFTAVGYNALRAILTDQGRFPARRRVVILDCCFAGAAITATMAAEDLDDAVNTEGTYLLAATTDREYAFAAPGARNTGFTGALLDALQRGLPDAGETLSLGQIFMQTKQLMRSRGLNAPRQFATDTIASLPLVRNATYMGTFRAPIETVLGVDLGDGDTVVTRLPVGRSEAMAEVELDSGETCIPTVLGESGTTTVIGTSAVMADSDFLRTRLKSNLTVADEETAHDIVRFSRGIRDSIVRRMTIASDQTQFVAGHPVRWAAGSRELAVYANALTDGLGAMDLQLVPESRAVLLSLRHSGDLNDDDLRRRVMIIDVGSFSTDITLVEDLEAVEISGPETPSLGASIIDVALLRHLIDRDTSDLDFAAHFATRPQDRDRLLLEVRRAKETWFNILIDRNTSTHRVRVSAPEHIDDAIELRGWSIAEPDVSAALGESLAELSGRSWRHRFLDDVRRALRSLHQPPDRICLTGGGSRMPFLAEIITEETGLAPIRPWPPHLAVARGLALSGDARVRAEGFLREVDNLAGQLRDTVYDQLPAYAKALAGCVADNLTERFVVPEFLAWREATSGTLNQLPSRIDERITAWLASPQGTAALGGALQPWQYDLMKAVSALTTPVCRRYHIDDDALDLPLVYINDHLVGHAVGQDARFRGPVIGPALATLTGAASLAVLVAALVNLPAAAGSAIAIGGGPVGAAGLVGGLGLIGLVVAGIPEFRKYLGDQFLTRSIPPTVRRAVRPKTIRRRLHRFSIEIDSKARTAIVERVLDPKSRDHLTQIIVHGDPSIPGAGLLPLLRARAEAVTSLMS
ncbi:caspase, EACC1-associated type [Micromonospora sp. WMMD735]|uniref:caspase, EACC1-associated type n=1 Tax=Micromonospora sp. WMMD735 TaxID=3404130 RepID=UPI003B956391